MRTSLLYLVILVFLLRPGFSQNQKIIKDYELRLSANNISLQEKIQTNITLATEFTGANKDSALLYLGNAKSLFTKSSSLKDKADAEYLESLIYYTASEFDRSQLALNQCVELSKRLCDKLLLSKAYNLLGAIAFN